MSLNGLYLYLCECVRVYPAEVHVCCAVKSAELNCKVVFHFGNAEVLLLFSVANAVIKESAFYWLTSYFLN